MSRQGTESIYLDHAATSPIRPEVWEAMAPYFSNRFGNAGSVHRFGRVARRAIDTAREQVAQLIHADPRDIIFTSGGTESDNLAIFGISGKYRRGSRARLAVSAVEHHAVLDAAKALAKHDTYEVVTARVDEAGRVDSVGIEESVDSGTILVSVMHGNNETGVIQPIETIGRLCRDRGVFFHTDAVQSIQYRPIDIAALPVDAVTVSGHKLGGPKGIGALYLRRGLPLDAQLIGGVQERGRRAGTENVPAIVGFGKACELALGESTQSARRMTALRDRLEAGLLEQIGGIWINGSGAERLPHILNAGFDGIEGETLLYSLDQEGIAVSNGSACTSGSLDPSHVLLAMGQSYQQAQCAVRFSLGYGSSETDVDRVIDRLPAIVERLRAESPLPRAG